PGSHKTRARLPGNNGGVLKALAVAVVALVALAGAWLASSLAVYFNGPRWLAAAAALALCPLAPIAWELSFQRPRRRGGAFARICVEALFLNAAVIAVVLGMFPAASFAALTTRGDWMLEGAGGREAEVARRALHGLADRLEWLYRASREQPYERLARQTPQPPPPRVPAQTADTGGVVVGSYTVDGKTVVVTERPDAPRSPPRPASPAPLAWPLPPQIHPAVASLSPSAEQSIAQVASALSAAERDPAQRVKALHDYVADRVRYDLQSQPQDPESVFRARKAVCAGYSSLFAALAKEAGLEVAIIVGVGKTGDGDQPISHAWNAVKLDGRWHLVDVTWDAGAVRDGGYVQRYSTDFLLTPPPIFARTHFPDDPGWQLLDRPLTRGEFWRQVDLRPAFYAAGLELLGPERSQIDASGSVALELSNPRSVPLYATVALGAEPSRSCATELSARTRITCQLPASGTYRLRIFGGAPQPGPDAARRYDQLAALDVNSRG
ncbi:MAG TPA: transglutaminase domain-containing protein, partial [Myxococcales bacterium]|nr:transglutaminase domain-containing protein [Myxococcales bacterium]